MNLGAGRPASLERPLALVGSAGDAALAQALLEYFPGDVLLIDPMGQVVGGRCNSAGGASPAGLQLAEALGLAETDDAIAMLQIWLASIAGTDEGGWMLHLDEPPAAVTRPDRVRLALEYVPLYQAGIVEQVLILARSLAESDTPSAPAPVRAVAAADVATFLVEARGYLAECDAARERLVIDRAARHALNHLFRALHTLKGSARAAGLRAIEAHTHQAEDDLEILRALDRPLHVDEVDRLAVMLSSLRTLIEELDAGQDEEEPAGEAFLSRIIEALERCRAAVDQSQSDREAAARELERAVGALGARPIRALVAGAERVARALECGSGITSAIDSFDNALFRLGELATELARSPLPGHAVVETHPLLEALDRGFEGWHRQPGDLGSLHSLWRATAVARAAAISFDLPTIQSLADRALAHIGSEPRQPEAITAAMVELSARLDELQCLGPLAPQCKNVDVLAAFHDEARKLLSQMHRALRVWSERLRDPAALATMFELTHTYSACARRYRLPALSAHAEQIQGLVQQALRSARPQRSLLARVDRWLDELDEHLRLYCTFMVEVHSARGGHQLLASAAARLQNAQPPVADLLRTLADEAGDLGILTLRSALREGTPDAELRIQRLLTDAPWFRVAPAERPQSVEDDGERFASIEARLQALDAALADELVVLPPASREAYARLRRDLRGLTRVPLSELTGRLSALADDLGAELGKQVHLRFEGEDAMLEDSQRRKVGEILLHAVRNAIDHGLEPGAARLRAGKPEQGLVTIAVSEGPAHLRIQVRDDGRGVDRSRVVARAVERGLISTAQAASMTEAEIDQLLFRAGFSTADGVSTISGRGVGMDAIKLAAEELGGQAVIESTPGAGTTITITIPL